MNAMPIRGLACLGLATLSLLPLRLTATRAESSAFERSSDRANTFGVRPRAVQVEDARGLVLTDPVDAWFDDPALLTGSDGADEIATIFALTDPPANDNFASATALGTTAGDAPPFNVQGDNVNATKEPGEPNHAGNAGGHSVWWKWTAPGNFRVSVFSANSNFNTALAVYTGAAVNALTPVRPVPFTVAGPGMFFFDATPGITYHIAVDGVDGATGNITLALGALATTPPSITGQPKNTAVTVGADAILQVFVAGSDPFNYQWFFNNAAIDHANSSSLFFFRAKSSDAGSYHVVVSNSFGTATSVAVTLTVNANLVPMITVQPANQSITMGQNAVFAVEATGAATLSYQWLFNGTPIGGATGSTLTVPNVQESNAGAYSVTVTNGFGSATSGNASLAVFPIATKPVITVQPVGLNATVGANVSFSVTATGFPAVSYQWLHNGTPIPNATGATLTLDNVQTSHAGSYSVNATNALGTTASNAVVLTLNPVTPPPAASGSGGGAAAALPACGFSAR
ncbi:MAG: immunoglobulin domain-containing protein [Opitutae bacterium]|nr:immunoglobulin domain-containing protein [Opitutae bacterium]